ncbi:glycosyltransferase [Aureococcus anophagefferens]|nr:glycosyltransferase [Aureococcus anophagefferens]
MADAADPVAEEVEMAAEPPAAPPPAAKSDLRKSISVEFNTQAARLKALVEGKKNFITSSPLFTKGLASAFEAVDLDKSGRVDIKAIVHDVGSDEHPGELNLEEFEAMLVILLEHVGGRVLFQVLLAFFFTPVFSAFFADVYYRVYVQGSAIAFLYSKSIVTNMVAAPSSPRGGGGAPPPRGALAAAARRRVAGRGALAPGAVSVVVPEGSALALGALHVGARRQFMVQVPPGLVPGQRFVATIPSPRRPPAAPLPVDAAAAAAAEADALPKRGTPVQLPDDFLRLPDDFRPASSGTDAMDQQLALMMQQQQYAEPSAQRRGFSPPGPRPQRRRGAGPAASQGGTSSIFNRMSAAASSAAASAGRAGAAINAAEDLGVGLPQQWLRSSGPIARHRPGGSASFTVVDAHASETRLHQGVTTRFNTQQRYKRSVADWFACDFASGASNATVAATKRTGDLAYCLAPVFGTNLNAALLIEWLEYHVALGFDRIHFYNMMGDRASPDTRAVLARYVARGYVVNHDWSMAANPGPLWANPKAERQAVVMYAQSVALYDCYLREHTSNPGASAASARAHGPSDWVWYGDVDEVAVVPLVEARKKQNLKALMAELPAKTKYIIHNSLITMFEKAQAPRMAPAPLLLSVVLAS